MRNNGNLDVLNDRTDYQQCFVCGQRNSSGLRVDYRSEGDGVVTEFTPDVEHQGYPGLCHGGILMALLDETAGRVAMLERRWVMTMKLETRFRSPVRIGERLIIRGTPIRWRGRILEAKAEVLLPDGSVAVDARGVYVRLPKVIAADTAERLPEFERFWERTDVG